eukprot:1319449-Amorphochlora_amoeboformis.AAC.3
MGGKFRQHWIYTSPGSLIIQALVQRLILRRSLRLPQPIVGCEITPIVANGDPCQRPEVVRWLRRKADSKGGWMVVRLKSRKAGSTHRATTTWDISFGMNFGLRIRYMPRSPIAFYRHPTSPTIARGLGERSRGRAAAIKNPQTLTRARGTVSRHFGCSPGIRCRIL